MHGTQTTPLSGLLNSNIFQFFLSLPPMTPTFLISYTAFMAHATQFCTTPSAIMLLSCHFVKRQRPFHDMQSVSSSANISESKHLFLGTGCFLVHKGTSHSPIAFELHKLQDSWLSSFYMKQNGVKTQTQVF